MSDEIVIDEKQKLLLEMFVSDHEIFAKCLSMIQPRYFDKPLDTTLDFIKEYYAKHHGLPDLKIVKIETGVELELMNIESTADVSYALEELEMFCRTQDMSQAILDSVDDVHNGRLTSVEERVRQSLLVGIDKSVGVNVMKNAKERIEATEEDTDERCIGIPAFDKLINKVRRREVGIIYGTTGAGKSVMLGNVGSKFSGQGLHGIVITLELQEALYAKRLDCIIAGADIAKHKFSADAIQEVYDQLSEDGSGSIVVKYLKTQSTCGDIRAKLLEYELEYGRKPDYILVDYMGLMGVDGVNATAMNKFDFDELKIFGLQSIAADYDAYLITAGQLNRDGADIIDVTHKHVAGGLSAVNGSDWAVAIVATEEQLDNNQFQMKQLKIRNGGRSTMPITLYKSPETLRVSESPNAGQQVLPTKNPEPGAKQKVKSKPDHVRGKPVFHNQQNPSADDIDKTDAASKLQRFKLRR